MGSFIVNDAPVAFWIIYFISWLFVIIEQDYYKAKKNRNLKTNTNILTIGKYAKYIF